MRELVEVETAVLRPRRRQRCVDLGATRGRALGLAEHLRGGERDQIGRAPVAVELRGVDGELERAAPVAPPDLDLEQAVERVQLVLRIVLQAPEPGER